MKTFKTGVFILALLMLLAAVTACSNGNDTIKDGGVKDEQETVDNESASLLVYCGAGLKKPMTEISQIYQQENNIKIEYVFAGSTQLLGQVELSGKGDVFIVGSKKAYASAVEKGLAEECMEVAYHNPAIGVQKGNPLNIKSLEDLAKPGVKVVLGDEEANAIGETSQRIIEKTGLDGINDNVVSKTSTVNELIVHLTSKDADAAIITEDSAFQNEGIELVEIPEDINIAQIIPVGTLKSTQQEDEAKRFVDFVCSNKGKKIFEKYGFPPVK